MVDNRVARQPFWIIAEQGKGPLDVLTVCASGDEKILPIFSHKEEARTFLETSALEMNWRARKTTAGELVSILYALCAGVEKVALDPPALDYGPVMELVSLDRRDLARTLVGEERALYIGARDEQGSDRY